MNTTIKIIPKHFTSVLQPLDVGIFANFKQTLKKHYLLHFKSISSISEENERRKNLFNRVDNLFFPDPAFVQKCFDKCLRPEMLNNENLFNVPEIQEHPNEHMEIE